MLFKPTYVFNNVTEITVDFLNKHNIKGLLLDLDNTLTTHNNPVPPQSSLDWLDRMKESGIKMMIVSNNSSKSSTVCQGTRTSFCAKWKKTVDIWIYTGNKGNGY